MLRFPNPGSTIDTFVSVYVAAFERLNGQAVSLDDIVKAVVAANLATSSGYMGKEAVLRSTRDDRSRDPLYNQLKMYAELFRVLGWLHPTEKSRLTYTFTLLGHQVVAAGQQYLRLFRECALGIVYPSHVLTVKGIHELRPFAFILRTMRHADGYLSRDEMILGPLSCDSDRTPDAALVLARRIKGLRTSSDTMECKLTELSINRKTQVNTLRNYTRWPIAVLRHCGWTTEAVAAYEDGTKYQSWALTDAGRGIAERLRSMIDLRLSDVEQLQREERVALSVTAHYAMLGRSGFDLTPVVSQVTEAQRLANQALQRLRFPTNTDVLFSPFQTLSAAEIEFAFPGNAIIDESAAGKSFSGAGDGPVGRGTREHLFVKPKLISLLEAAATGEGDAGLDTGAQTVKAELIALLRKHGSVDDAVKTFVASRSSDTRVAFYPLVTHLFQILGYRSEHSRPGVNYQRWDASVWIGRHAVPVEIKSPTEEMFLSTKSVRQALENKVVLLSRGGLDTNRDLPSLIVGYRIPNERGDLSMLIDDIFKAYGLRIGILDLESLVTLALRSINENVTIDPRQLASLCGFLNV
jgi:hypothetical protein